jgi:hypothetical protein
MPVSMQASDAGIEFAADGGVSIGPEFRSLEAAWMEGVRDGPVDTTHTESLARARVIAAHAG